MALQPISFRWEPDFIARIDEARGDIPRTTYVRRILEHSWLMDERAEVAIKAAGQVVDTQEGPQPPNWARRGSPSPSLKRYTQ